MFKSDKAKGIVRNILIIILSIVFVVSAAMLINELVIKPYRQNKVTSQIQGVYNTAMNEESLEEKFKRLQEINPDIKGWISIENTVINYPVLEPPMEDKMFYLYRDYNKEDTKYGSIFVDPECGIKEDVKNTIILGHSMSDGKMFLALLKYSDLDFYKSSPVIRYDTVYEPGNWKIISIFKTNTDPKQGEKFNYMIYSFANDSKFLNYVNDVRKRSIINTPVDVNEDDKLITLSTCSYEFDGFRTVIVARKVREGEKVAVNVDEAYLNPNTLYPDAWYVKYSGQKPSDKTFEEALKAGEIYWYNN